MKPPFLILLGVLVCLSCYLPATPEPAGPGDLPGVEIAATVDKDRITIGDVFGYEIVITAPEGTRVDAPDTTRLLPLEVRDLTRNEETTDGRLRVSLAYKLQVFEVGKRTIAGLEAACLLPGKDKPAGARVPGVTLQVTGVVPPDAKDIMDIRDPVPIRMKRSDWIVAAVLAVVVLAVLVLVGLWIARRLRARRSRPAPPVILTPQSWALSRLADLERRNLPAQDDCPGHYAELTEILREFVEARFDLPANEGTTSTLARDLVRLEVDSELIQRLVEVLREADRVRFGRMPAGPSDAATALEAARETIRVAAPPEPVSLEGGPR